MILTTAASTPPASPWRSASARTVRAILATLSMAVFFLVSAHAPLQLHADYIHDDGLYISLGKYIASGEWLGNYGQFTLMKGPGYPLFLALNAWLGLPINILEALFHGTAIAFFFWVFARISKMPNLALCGFILSILYPAPYLDRITRDAIYPGETLLFLGALILALYADLPKRARITCALVSGLFAGWLAITREEGLSWTLPGVVVIAAYPAWIAWRQRSLIREVVTPLLATGLAFMAVQGGFACLNKIAYGRMTGVEINSSPFKEALAALGSVDAGRRIPYVPVSRQARFAIYAVSPSFRSLKDYFDPPSGVTPWQYGCQFYPESCGDIAGGWFLWALRDAVASKGHYSSPMAAADFYRTLTREIEQACHDGALQCSPTLIALFPHISLSQWKRLPASLLAGIRIITHARAAVTPPSSGDRDDLASDIAFLGYPARTPGPQDMHSYRISGWYHSANDSWITGQLIDGDDHVQAIPIPRQDSPDLVGAFKDPHAQHQRFGLVTSCDAECGLKFADEAGATATLSLAQPAMSREQGGHSIGSATLFIDNIAEVPSDYFLPNSRAKTSAALRTLSMRIFDPLMPWLAAAAALAAAMAGLMAILSRKITKLDVIAAAVWILLASRLLLLGLIDISSFPGMIVPYLAPAYVLLCIAVVLSFGALLETRFKILGAPAGEH